ncbi:MAG: methyltransferase domain-containing protein [Oceanospirillales bacterium]|nr:MAG: methyltransferase domain-containing protein [Oceanospirillales bacterium]
MTPSAPENSLPLRCPVCSAALIAGDLSSGKQLSCEAGHSFDRARQGYWNLLLAQRKRSKAPGDNDEMVQARHNFLSLGHYQPIATAIQECITKLVTEKLAVEVAQPQYPLVLDLGCGEGYYTQQIHQALTSISKDAQCVGLDISKPAILHASKQHKQITWLVATGADIPLMSESVDIATLIFARLLPEPTAQVLKPGGYFLVVWPGPDHLRELREQIYTDVRDSDLNPDEQLLPLFETINTQTCRFRFKLNDGDAISNLLMMTPHGQRLSQAAKETIVALEQLEIQADIRLSLYRKR